MVLKYLDALSSNSENMMKLLQNVYIDRENNYEFLVIGKNISVMK